MEQNNLSTKSLDEAVYLVLRQLGANALDNGNQFEAAMRDVYQSESATARVFFRNCDGEVLAPFYEALESEDRIKGLRVAATKVGAILATDRMIVPSLSESVAHEMMEGIVRYLNLAAGVVSENELVPATKAERAEKADQGEPARKKPVQEEPVPAATVGFAQGNHGRGVHKQPERKQPEQKPSQDVGGSKGKGEPESKGSSKSKEGSQKGKRGSRRVVVAVLVVAVLIAASFALRHAVWLHEPTSSDSSKTFEDISITDVGETITWQAESWRKHNTRLVVRIRNDTEQSIAAKIVVDYYTSSEIKIGDSVLGSKIGEFTDNCDFIGPGETAFATIPMSILGGADAAIVTVESSRASNELGSLEGLCSVEKISAYASQMNVRITNTSDRPIYIRSIALVNMDEQGESCFALSRSAGRLEPGEKTVCTFSDVRLLTPNAHVDWTTVDPTFYVTGWSLNGTAS